MIKPIEDKWDAIEYLHRAQSLIYVLKEVYLDEHQSSFKSPVEIGKTLETAYEFVNDVVAFIDERMTVEEKEPA